MLEYYIHQIGDISDPKTFYRLKSILDTKCIYSRKKLEEMGIVYSYENSSFKFDISPEKEYIYYMDDIHFDKISLSDPNNKFVKKAIEMKSHKVINCFDYDYIAFAISKDIKVVPKEETHGLELGEVQVQDLISEEYIKGIILPFEKNDLYNENISKIVDMISEFCNKNGMPLDIYNYEGDLLKGKTNKKAK